MNKSVWVVDVRTDGQWIRRFTKEWLDGSNLRKSIEWCNEIAAEHHIDLCDLRVRRATFEEAERLDEIFRHWEAGDQ